MRSSGIQEQTVQTMLEGSAARDVLGSRYHDKLAWPIRLGALPPWDALPRA